MENPILSNASPTIITGDKSQASVALHGIAHYWAGYLVTCRDWSNLWLNEGIAVFIERKVSAMVNGAEYPIIEAYIGNETMWDDINRNGLTNSYSSLFPIFNGHDPADSFSRVL